MTLIKYFPLAMMMAVVLSQCSAFLSQEGNDPSEMQSALPHNPSYLNEEIKYLEVASTMTLGTYLNAANAAEYQDINVKNVSWHYTVGVDTIYQHHPVDMLTGFKPVQNPHTLNILVVGLENGVKAVQPSFNSLMWYLTSKHEIESIMSSGAYLQGRDPELEKLINNFLKL